jgi:hypothetical protein
MNAHQKNRRLRIGSLSLSVLVSGCVATQSAPPTPTPKANYDFMPTQPCDQPGSTKLTFALVSPSSAWVDSTFAGSATPKVFRDLSQAMRGDLLELITCRGYLTKGPFATFDEMVYPDREASQLLLEPQLDIRVAFDEFHWVQSGAFMQALTKSNTTFYKFNGSATVGGHVTLSLKEPLTNTRMWTKSIEVPSETFRFTSDSAYGSPTGTMIPNGRAQQVVINDPGLLRLLLPKLEAMYGNVFRTTQNYLNPTEMQTVATQAADVRKKASIRIPPH